VRGAVAGHEQDAGVLDDGVREVGQRPTGRVGLDAGAGDRHPVSGPSAGQQRPERNDGQQHHAADRPIDAGDDAAGECLCQERARQVRDEVSER
jgi:hypothetical protein